MTCSRRRLVRAWWSRAPWRRAPLPHSSRQQAVCSSRNPTTAALKALPLPPPPPDDPLKLVVPAEADLQCAGPSCEWKGSGHHRKADERWRSKLCVLGSRCAQGKNTNQVPNLHALPRGITRALIGCSRWGQQNAAGRHRQCRAAGGRHACKVQKEHLLYMAA